MLGTARNGSEEQAGNHFPVSRDDVRIFNEPGAAVNVTTFVRTWFGRGTSNLARQCDLRRRIGLTPEVGGRSSRPNHALTCVVTVAIPGKLFPA